MFYSHDGQGNATIGQGPSKIMQEQNLKQNYDRRKNFQATKKATTAKKKISPKNLEGTNI